MKEAFQMLKAKLTSPPVLAFPDFDAPVIVGTDYSNVALGSMFSQKKDGRKVQPVQYAIRTTHLAEQNYSTCEREAVAVIFVLRKI